MDRRYQVFVSSPYMDLVEERREVIQALLEMDCLPAGMELFPAADDTQWTLIKQVIDESDYYVVIVGGRYGSIGSDGLSYTEMEYDYAVRQGKPVLGFVHAKPTEIPSGKTQPESQAALDAFLSKVKSRMVKTYGSPAELGSVVSRAMIRAIRQYPTNGWVRGEFAMTQEIQNELTELRAQIEQKGLHEESVAAGAIKPNELASGSDKYNLSVSIRYSNHPDNRTLYTPRASFIAEMSWDSMLSHLGPILMSEAKDAQIVESLGNVAAMRALRNPELRPIDFALPTTSLIEARVSNSNLNDVMFQFVALGLVTRLRKPGVNRYWTLTPLGEDTVIRLRAIRKSDDTPAT